MQNSGPEACSITHLGPGKLVVEAHCPVSAQFLVEERLRERHCNECQLLRFAIDGDDTKFNSSVASKGD
jgi:hypothetical protein